MTKQACYVIALIAATVFSTVSVADEVIADNCVLKPDEKVVGKYVLETVSLNEKGVTQRLGSIEQNQDATWSARIENVGTANDLFNDYWQAADFVCKNATK
jgi:hypothetical protein